MATKAPHILLINPWIYDFAAHDLWSKPLGLLLLAGSLRSQGFDLRLLDCLDIYDPRMAGKSGVKPATRRKFGTGKFHRTKMGKPAALADIPRDYWRFGIARDIFRERLLDGPEPGAVLVTSLMTYWYPGVQESIGLVKELLPGVPVILGGIYATLCPDHASRHSGADYVLPGPAGPEVPRLLENLGLRAIPKAEPSCGPQSFPWAAQDLFGRVESLCVLTSRGCPFRCPYCASSLLFPDFIRRQPVEVVDELQHWYERFGALDVAFYDDALLLAASEHILPLLAEIRRRELPFRFHTPNAVHISALTPEVCEALFTAGFKTLRLGLETADSKSQQRLGAKVGPGAFSRAMNNLRRAGFSPRDIGVYILCGLPGQNPAEVASSIRMVREHGARPYLAEFSPIPGTRMWPEAVRSSPFDLAGEPLYHNNSLLPCRGRRFGPDELQWLKELCRQ